MKVSINRFGHQESFALAAVLQFLKHWTHLLSDESLILFGGLSSLLELPLTFEQRGLIDVGENVLEWNVVDHARAKKRRRWNRHIRANIRAYGVRGIARNLCDAARSQRLAHAELCFFGH